MVNTVLASCTRRQPLFVEIWDYTVDHFVGPPSSKVIALGAGSSIVDPIVAGDGSDDPTLQNESVKRYFRLKHENRLAELTLHDGEILAESLVRAAIHFADAQPTDCFGIGGEIQVLAITKQGTEWIKPLDK